MLVSQIKERVWKICVLNSCWIYHRSYYDHECMVGAFGNFLLPWVVYYYLSKLGVNGFKKLDWVVSNIYSPALSGYMTVGTIQLCFWSNFVNLGLLAPSVLYFGLKLKDWIGTQGRRTWLSKALYAVTMYEFWRINLCRIYNWCLVMMHPEVGFVA